MTIGGNSKAKAYFKAHGVSENVGIEEKYKTKAAENYKQSLLDELSKGKQIKETTSSPSTPVTNSTSSLRLSQSTSKKSTLSMRELEEDLPKINRNGSSDGKESAFKNRFFDDFDDDDWGNENESEKEIEKSNYNETEIEENEYNQEEVEVLPEETIQKESKSKFKSSRFLYSDSLLDESEDFTQEKEHKKQQVVEKNDKKSNGSRNYRGVSMFDDNEPEPPKKNYDDLQRFFDEDDDYNWNRRSHHGTSSQRNNDKAPKEVFSRFENAKSISSSDFYSDNDNDDEDYYYNRRDSDDFDAVDLLTKIADTAKSDFKAIGETLYEGGKRLAEWFSDFTSDY